MRILDVREKIVPIKSNISNAYIDFSKMTVILLSLQTPKFLVRDDAKVI